MAISLKTFVKFLYRDINLKQLGEDKFCENQEFIYIAAYPAGTWVKLSTGEVAIVLETKKGMALRPKVKVLFDSGGNVEKEEKYLNLINITDITIKEVLNEEEIEKLSNKLKLNKILKNYKKIQEVYW